MSLIIEQRLRNDEIVEFSLSIYSSGVKLLPMSVIINNTKKYVWVANEFCDDTYFEGKLISPSVVFDNPENEIKNE